ncbi:MAG: glycosyltransferase family 2 protein [Phycisphaerae bacterium]
MAKNRQMVSLYVPAFNAAGTLPFCLASIIRMRPAPDEFLVVDDGSTDDTPRIAQKAGFTVIRHPKNRGVAAARNTAIKAARGELVASLDADQTAPRDWLARMLRNFEGRRKIVGCCGRVIEKYSDTIADRWRAVHMKLSFGMRRSYDPRWLHGGTMLLRDAIIDVGLYNERCLRAYEDVELVDRLKAAGHVLLYDPTIVATHLKKSRSGNVVRDFWSYWAAKNEIQGLYKSLAAACRLMIARQMGIAAYRIAQDLKHKRDELLPLDAIIPLAFCVRDLDEMVRLGRLPLEQARDIQTALMRCYQDVWRDVFPGECSTDTRKVAGMARLAFAAGPFPDGRTDNLTAAAKNYVATFRRAFASLLADLPADGGRRILRGVDAVLQEAEEDGCRGRGEAYDHSGNDARLADGSAPQPRATMTGGRIRTKG